MNRIATITVSDTRTQATDEGGARLRALFTAAGFCCTFHAIVADEPTQLVDVITRVCDEDLADVVVVTSDNPRSESPAAIIADILAGDPSATVEIDRAKAIALAVLEADVRDVILLAGKGHETYQETSGVRTPFSDIEQAGAALVQRQQLNKEVAA